MHRQLSAVIRKFFIMTKFIFILCALSPLVNAMHLWPSKLEFWKDMGRMIYPYSDIQNNLYSVLKKDMEDPEKACLIIQKYELLDHYFWRMLKFIVSTDCIIILATEKKAKTRIYASLCLVCGHYLLNKFAEPSQLFLEAKDHYQKLVIPKHHKWGEYTETESEAL